MKNSIFLLGISLFVLISCKKDEEETKKEEETTSVSSPTVTTTSITNISMNTASGGGEVTSDGNGTVTERGICYSTSANPTVLNSQTSDGSGKGVFTSSLTGLTANTTYYVRAYAINSAGTSYGNQVLFTTTASATVATVSTTGITSKTSFTAEIDGSVTSDGGSTVTERGICYHTSSTPTTSNNKVSSGTGTGTFTGSISGLTASTTYYARAYAINAIGTSYGSEISFTTDQIFPTTTGDATIQILNHTTTSGNYTVINANAGDEITLALLITKGTNRPQKLRAYSSLSTTVQGTLISLAGQTGSEDGDTRFDLRNTDDPQYRNIRYTVPSGNSVTYLHLEIDEGSSKYSYALVQFNVSGPSVLDSYTNVTLGAQASIEPSRLCSATGLTYTACNAAANIDYIDISYAVKTASPFNSYLCSNPAKYVAPINLSTTLVSCGEDGSLNVSGGQATYFKAYSGSASDFDNATNTTLGALTVSNSDPQYIEITAINQVFEFLNSDGKKGLIKVTSATLNSSLGDITISYKVQR